jgi:hypothetical protein
VSRIRRQRAISQKHRETVAREADRTLHLTVDAWCATHGLEVAIEHVQPASVIASIGDVAIARSLAETCLREFGELAEDASVTSVVEDISASIAMAETSDELASLVVQAGHDLSRVVADAHARYDLAAAAVAAAADAGVEVAVTTDAGTLVEMTGVSDSTGQHLDLVVKVEGDGVILETVADSPDDAVHALHPDAAEPCLPSEALADRFDAYLDEHADALGLDLLDATTVEPSSRGGRGVQRRAAQRAERHTKKHGRTS